MLLSIVKLWGGHYLLMFPLKVLEKTSGVFQFRLCHLVAHSVVVMTNLLLH